MMYVVCSVRIIERLAVVVAGMRSIIVSWLVVSHPSILHYVVKRHIIKG